MVDICGEPLNIGDKVSTRWEQLYRVGVITGFTKKMVIVGFDCTCSNSGVLTEAKFAPFNLTKIIRQSVGLQDYFQYH